MQCLSSIFDSLVYFNPVILKVKLLLKKLWLSKCNWDYMVNDEFMKEWELISKQLEAIPLHQLPRYFGIGEKSGLIKYQLVCFCDASGMVYATTIYLNQSIESSKKETESEMKCNKVLYTTSSLVSAEGPSDKTRSLRY